MAEFDELAKGLFAVDHVISVFMQDKFITVTKDDGIGWTELLPKLAPPIRQAPSTAGQAPEAPHWERPEVDLNDPLLQDVRKVLEAAILPALAADGGGLDIVGRHEKQIMIRYQGACTSCPSGLTGTLMAIEGILRKEVDPEIVVISV
jgi:Fe-S cluster biogenesis protein NfuA